MEKSELFRLVRLDHLPPTPIEPIIIETTAVERSALAKRFSWANVPAARFTLMISQEHAAFWIRGMIDAQVSLDGEKVLDLEDAPFVLKLIPGDTNEIPDEDELMLDYDIEGFASPEVDIGEICAQYLYLAVEAQLAYATVPMPEDLEMTQDKPNPFAALSKLKKP